MSPLLDIAVEHKLGSFTLDASFTSDGRLTALFGRSGSGKTSLVNVIGGLIRPQVGHVIVDGQVLVDTRRGIFVPKHRRRIGYVFQEARLFPHLTVRQNLLFGRWFTPKAETDGKDLPAVLDLLGIGHLLDRRPTGLSGGEKQRVAIGRALLARPRLLLMDEPLASLDEARKAEILPYIERLRDEMAIPIVYVSHSAAEVARLATTLAIVDQGAIKACGPTAEVMSRLDMARLPGAPEASSLLEAKVIGFDAEYGLTRLETRAGTLQVARAGLALGSTLRVRILASDVMVSLSPLDGISALNVLAGTVAEIGERSEAGAVDLRIDCNGEMIVARLTAKSVAALALKSGSPVYAVIKSVSIDAP
ncbi:molybdenum ABC transporter ATP-binding protein [Bosea caraganae]|uniref:Molybdenum ABC transporter ATP-binding protein n=1 Tax=Bosea caraganae TaxID=2763117 RepID=A0A370L2B7_9HYPH|nr:molybdenum ABC transporter ATP-binding protein [Bosea caraganae]RDJ21256.1 molybdenum ABC transporter ATP-binding protein [Bosea caraganae]RDJ26396.1 molybdenum ABC transporter ATP-binding protein [Bosea caraganae]